MDVKDKKDSELENVGATIAVAFYNVAAELEHLHHYKEASFACKHGLDVCTGILGSKHGLCEKLKEFIAAIEKYKEMKFEIILEKLKFQRLFILTSILAWMKLFHGHL